MVLININCCLKGCVQGYGNYEELTSIGVDPAELFGNIENCGKSPDLVLSEEPDIVLDNARKDIRCSHNLHSLSVGRQPKSTYLESNRNSIFDLEYITPSLFSSTTHDNLMSTRDNKKVTNLSVYNNISLHPYNI